MVGAVEFQNVTVTVPVTRVGDLLAYAADLARSQDEDERERAYAAQPMSPAAVRMAYLGGKSDHWRPFIDALVSQPDEWVEWLRLCDTIGLRPPQAAGMLGAAERRCGMRPPYEKRQMGGVIYFRVSSEVAAIIRDTGEERSGSGSRDRSSAAAT